MNRDIPEQYEIYKHFNGKFYKIVTVGHLCETGERMVVYYDICNETSTANDPCVCPLDIFMSEVDHEKYPDVKQKYRFEKEDYLKQNTDEN